LYTLSLHDALPIFAEHLQREERLRARFREEMDEDTRAEFLNGEVFVHSPAKFKHNRIAQRAYKLLDSFVAPRHLGIVGHEKHLVALTRNDVEPDVVYWRAEKSAAFTDD